MEPTDRSPRLRRAVGRGGALARTLALGCRCARDVIAVTKGRFSPPAGLPDNPDRHAAGAPSNTEGAAKYLNVARGQSSVDRTNAKAEKRRDQETEGQT
jgi:hypothetical protein